MNERRLTASELDVRRAESLIEALEDLQDEAVAADPTLECLLAIAHALTAIAREAVG